MNTQFKITAEDIARQLGKGREVRQGDGWVTLCPAHNDSSPSFSVAEGRDGKILVNCHAGCSQTSVIQALKDQGLWPKTTTHQRWRPLPHAPKDREPPNMAHPKEGTPTKRWIYRDREGRVAGVICRFDKPGGGKTVAPITWCVDDDTGEAQWRWLAMLRPRPLYRSDIIAKTHKDITVLVVEGEKACDAAVDMFPNLMVTTWSGGSKAVVNTDWSLLRGRKVVIWPDNDEPGQKAAAAIAEVLIAEGVESVAVVALPDRLPEGWDLADTVPDNVEIDPKLLIGAAKSYTPSGDVVVDEVNRSFALTIMGDKSVVIWEKPSPIHGRIIPMYTSTNAIATFMSNRRVTVGKAEVPAFQHWLTHPSRRSYEGIVFQPGEEVNGYYNLWRGFTVVPEATGDWSMLREHVIQNVCNGDESLANWVFGWFAQMFQNPKVKPGTSLALRGKQGVGKTKLGELMGHLIRDNYVYVDEARYVIGNFNSHMGHALLLQADEGFFAGDPRHAGRLKGLVTSETNRIEPKGKDSFEIRNYMRLMITSNSEWIVPTALEERRFAILDVADTRMQDRAYFKAMDKQMEQGGYEGLLHYLLNMDLSTIDVGVIPKTSALADQKELSMDPIQRWWLERLHDAATFTGYTVWEKYAATELLYEDFVKRCKTWGIMRAPSKTQLVNELQGMTTEGSFEQLRKTIEIKGQDGYVYDRRVWCYKMPKLEDCRRIMCERLGMTIEWPEEEVYEEEDPQDEADGGRPML